MYFATNASKIHIMHAVGVYIMPPLAVVQKTVFAKHDESEKPPLRSRSQSKIAYFVRRQSPFPPPVNGRKGANAYAFKAKLFTLLFNDSPKLSHISSKT